MSLFFLSQINTFNASSSFNKNCNKLMYWIHGQIISCMIIWEPLQRFLFTWNNSAKKGPVEQNAYTDFRTNWEVFELIGILCFMFCTPPNISMKQKVVKALKVTSIPFWYIFHASEHWEVSPLSNLERWLKFLQFEWEPNTKRQQLLVSCHMGLTRNPLHLNLISHASEHWEVSPSPDLEHWLKFS